jgi:hypothetical protein
MICDIANECMPSFCEVISFDDWLWSYSAVQSRSFLAPLPVLKKVKAGQSKLLGTGSTPPQQDRCGGGSRDTDSANVPLIDMANHGITIKGVKRGANSAYRFDHNTKSFKLFALEPVAEGQAILVDYGIADNHHSMSNYGFAHNLPGYSFMQMSVEVMGSHLKYKLEKTKDGAGMLQHMFLANHVLLHRGTDEAVSKVVV